MEMNNPTSVMFNVSSRISYGNKTIGLNTSKPLIRKFQKRLYSV